MYASQTSLGCVEAKKPLHSPNEAVHVQCTQAEARSCGHLFTTELALREQCSLGPFSLMRCRVSFFQRLARMNLSPTFFKSVPHTLRT